jgi:endo-beta-N-acetylglucosaminidase D
MTIINLINNYNTACNELVKRFEKKHGYGFTGWVANEIGVTAVFIDQYFFNMDDIVLDLKEKAPKVLIFKWQDDSLKHEHKRINFKSYLRGLRFEHLED